MNDVDAEASGIYSGVMATGARRRQTWTLPPWPQWSDGLATKTSTGLLAELVNSSTDWCSMWARDKAMLTQQRILELIKLPKTIVGRRPSHGYREESGSRRCDLDLRSPVQDDNMFAVFIRQSLKFAENFSIGLRYRADLPLGAITLLRYNGPHGESSRAPDGHYAKPHIHRITQQEINSGSTQPQERDRTITDAYATLEQALWVFFNDAGVSNPDEYFPEIGQLRLSYGHQ